MYVDREERRPTGNTNSVCNVYGNCVQLLKNIRIILSDNALSVNGGGIALSVGFWFSGASERLIFALYLARSLRTHSKPSTISWAMVWQDEPCTSSIYRSGMDILWSVGSLTLLTSGYRPFVEIHKEIALWPDFSVYLLHIGTCCSYGTRVWRCYAWSSRTYPVIVFSSDESKSVWFGSPGMASPCTAVRIAWNSGLTRSITPCP